MRWFIPTWNGDLRLERVQGNPKQTLLTVLKPSPYERGLLEGLRPIFIERGWVKASGWWEPEGPERQLITLKGPIEAIAPLVAKTYRPGKDTLTAVVLRDERLQVLEGDMKEEDVPTDAKKAVTVRRPTPSCPSCEPGPISPAAEVLEEFLTPAEAERWRKERRIVVIGGVTGHRYVLAHRHSPTACMIGRIGYDLDDQAVCHFHDRTVPPEEEVLSAKLVLEHRERWLRNDATIAGGGPNPFGTFLQGVPSTALTVALGFMGRVRQAQAQMRQAQVKLIHEETPSRMQVADHP